MRCRESRWRLFQYSACWRKPRFSRCSRCTSSQLGHFAAQVGDQIREGRTRLTELCCWPIHDHLGLTRMVQKEKRLVPFQPDQKHRVDVLGEALRRSSTWARTVQAEILIPARVRCDAGTIGSRFQTDRGEAARARSAEFDADPARRNLRRDTNSGSCGLSIVLAR